MNAWPLLSLAANSVADLLYMGMPLQVLSCLIAIGEVVIRHPVLPVAHLPENRSQGLLLLCSTSLSLVTRSEYPGIRRCILHAERIAGIFLQLIKAVLHSFGKASIVGRTALRGFPPLNTCKARNSSSPRRNRARVCLHGLALRTAQMGTHPRPREFTLRPARVLQPGLDILSMPLRPIWCSFSAGGGRSPCHLWEHLHREK